MHVSTTKMPATILVGRRPKMFEMGTTVGISIRMNFQARLDRTCDSEETQRDNIRAHEQAQLLIIEMKFLAEKWKHGRE